MRLLDLFCGGGGAAMGYSRAGFDEIVGIDCRPQPQYPFVFIKADAFAFVAEYGHTFDVIHASPPCQGYSQVSERWRQLGKAREQPAQEIARIRDLISSRPYVIENVMGARRDMRDPICLTGGQFGLRVHRPRFFESSIALFSLPPACVRDSVAVYGRSPDGRWTWQRRDGSRQRVVASIEEGSVAMGIDWLPWASLKEAIPPAYTEFIGHQILAVLADSRG